MKYKYSRSLILESLNILTTQLDSLEGTMDDLTNKQIHNDLTDLLNLSSEIEEMLLDKAKETV